jgi:hypothetical protein
MAVIKLTQKIREALKDDSGNIHFIKTGCLKKAR